MRRTTSLASVALLAGLALAGCSDSTSSDDATAAQTTAGGDEGGITALCSSFFEGMGNPLAERATAARAALSGGEVTDDVTYGEINMLEQRISDLAEDAPADVAGTLEDVNAPFTDAVQAYNDFRAQPAEGDDMPPFVDLTTIDVSGSEQAQTEFETACADAGYAPAE